jgi:hypothetical protein
MADQIAHQTTVLPEQPAMLVVGGRRILIDEWPLARSVDERCSMEVSRPSGDWLVIRQKKRAGAGLIIQGLLVLLCGALPSAIAAASEAPWWVSILLGLAMLSFLILMIRGLLSRLRWVRFDRKAGRLVLERRAGFRRERRIDGVYPLTVIKAVQLLHNGRHSVTETQGAGEQQTVSHREFFGYKLNLLLDSPEQPRLHLFSLADWQWIRQTGQLIGEFLGVPVIDKLYHGA